MGKPPINLKKELARVTIALLFLIILTSVAAINQVAKAQDQVLSITPNQGPAGAEINVYGTGFNTAAPISISFGDSQIAIIYASSGIVNTEITVPSVSSGSYIVTAMDLASYSMQHNAGLSASASFIVISGSPIQTPIPTAISSSTQTAPTIPPTTSSSENPIEHPYYQPTPSPRTENSGFWSPLTIGIIAAALIVFFVPATLMYTKRNKQKLFLDKEPSILPPHTQEPPVAPNRATATTRYSRLQFQSQQQTTPVTNAQYNQQPSHIYSQQLTKPPANTQATQSQSYNRQQSFTKVCPRCKKSVRDDLNICPYCDKRLR